MVRIGPVLTAAVSLAVLVAAVIGVAWHGSEATELGWEAEWRDDQSWVGWVEPDGPAAGRLVGGDRLIAVDGDPGAVDYAHNLERRLQGLLAQPRYTVDVERGGRHLSFTLSPGVDLDPKRHVALAVNLLVALTFLGIGLTIGFLRWDDRLARMAALALAVSAVVWTRGAAFPIVPHTTGVVRVGIELSALAWPWPIVLGFLFCYRFPPGAPPSHLWRSVAWTLVSVGVLVWLAGLPLNLVNLVSPERAYEILAAHAGAFALRREIMSVHTGLCELAMVAVSLRNYQHVTAPGERQRMKWVVVGVVAGMAPMVLSYFLSVAWSLGGRDWDFNEPWLYAQFSTLATVLMPVCLAYAVLKHRVLDVRLAVRRSVQHLLARNLLRLVVLLPAAFLLASVALNPDRTVRELLFDSWGSLTLLGLAALALRYRTQLQEWLDRRFFAEAYDQERILLGLLERVKTLDSIAEVSRVVCAEIDAALHPDGVHAFFQDRDRPPDDSSDSALFRVLESAELPADVDSMASGLAAPEAKWLKELRVVLIVPMRGTDHRLAGLLLLGAKRSEQPYTQGDRRLLGTLAAQMAMVYENMTLKRHVDRERRAQEEVLARLGEQNLAPVKHCPRCLVCYDGSVVECPADGTRLELPAPVERTLDGKYRLEKLAGRGGMSVVFEATDLRLSRRVALKVMIGARFDDQALRRFERETRTTGRIAHENIVTVYDCGRIRAEGAYIVMEMLKGMTLRAELKRRGALLPALAAERFAGVLAGVHAAHRAGVVHRDLKPENVFLVARPERAPLVKLLDFGLARMTGELADGSGLTSPGMVIGTIGYMAPEQLCGEEVDARADVFSVGVMLVEALTGRRPFQGKTITELLTAMLRAPFHLDGEGETVRKVEEVLARCLAREKDVRFGSIEELEREIMPLLAICPSLVAPGVTPAAEEDTRPVEK